jgi:hypothetical protein
MPKSANKSSLLTSDEIVFGAIGRTLFAAVQENALARGFCEAAQPERTAATMQRIVHANFGDMFAAPDFGIATRTGSKM